MNLIYNEETGTWGKAPEYSMTVYFDTEDGMEEFNSALKNWHKYRWHDLRKNPDDLPKDGKLVEIVYVPAHLPIHTLNYRYGHEYGGEGFNKRTDTTVIAWREVELFDAIEPYKVKEK